MGYERSASKCSVIRAFHDPSLSHPLLDSSGPSTGLVVGIIIAVIVIGAIAAVFAIPKTRKMIFKKVRRTSATLTTESPAQLSPYTQGSSEGARFCETLYQLTLSSDWSWWVQAWWRLRSPQWWRLCLSAISWLLCCSSARRRQF